MDDRPPDTPETTPNPHRGEPAPPANEGKRPEADADVVRPDEEEPNGPLGGLMHASSTEVKAHGPGDTTEAQAEAARLGVEGEGIESSQILGLVVATVAAIACLVLFIVYLFYIPTLGHSKDLAADVPDSRYVEQRELRSEALDLLGHYATSPSDSSLYRIPVEAAMAQVARQYATTAPAEASDQAPAFTSPSDFNLSWITLTPPPAVQRSAEGTGPDSPAVDVAPPAPGAEAEAAAETPSGEAPPGEE